jgi:hypothetical protein
MMRNFTAYQLKWLALITMTIDHFGVLVLYPYTNNTMIDTLYIISRLIGRLAFPLFAFMIAEGIYRTKHRYLYFSKLFAMALLIGLSMFVLEQININALAGNIFVDLSMAALAMILLKEKSWLLKPLGLLPIAYVIWTSFNPSVPNFLRADYGFYGLLMMLIFFFTYTKVVQEKLTTLLRLNQSGKHNYVLASVALLLMHVVWYIIEILVNQGMPSGGLGLLANYLSRFVGAQTYAVVAGYFIYYYRGDKGNAPSWFQLFSYAYYPLHFIGLYGIYLLTIWIQ